jgi:gamma-glutamyltranspeptidase/glutathione hydrolase
MKQLGGIAAGHTLTAQAGAEILMDGGTAVDAAIAAMLTACVCEPVLASPAGGGFAMVSAGGKPACLDFFVQTPKHPNGKRHDGLREVDADFGGVTQTFHIGPGSVATPGFLPGLFALHERYGTLPMVRLAEFAIALAKEGVTVTPYQAKLATIVAPILTASEDAQALHTRDETLLGAGDVFRNKALADALDAVAREGARLATQGEVAHLMVEAANGGHLSLEDVSAYEAVWREPLIRSFSFASRPPVETKGLARPVDRRIFLNPTPSAGGGLIAAVLASYQAGDHYDPLAFAKALDAVDKRWRKLGKPVGFDDRMIAASPASVASRGTTHVSAVDREGRAVAITVSNGEGNGAIVPGCGFMLNNMLGEDDLLADGPGSWQPDQRLSSMMASTLVADGKGGLLALGSGGSNRIRSAMAQVLLRWGAHGQPLEDAIRAPRLHVEEGHLDVEPGQSSNFDPEHLQRAFEDHRIWDEPSMFFGGAHGVERKVNADGRVSLEGAGDERRDGVFVRV